MTFAGLAMSQFATSSYFNSFGYGSVGLYFSHVTTIID